MQILTIWGLLYFTHMLKCFTVIENDVIGKHVIREKNVDEQKRVLQNGMYSIISILKKKKNIWFRKGVWWFIHQNFDWVHV